MKYRILIVDDEVSGRLSLSILLEKYFWAYIETISFANSFEEAKEQLKQSNFHIIFLDVNLRGISAFDLLTAIPSTSKVIFITDYSEYILKALRNRLYDYLIKPIQEDDLKECLNRVTKDNILKESTFHIKQHGLTRIVNLSEIYFIEGDGPYSKFNIQNEVIVTARTLKSILPEIGDSFVRIHKSYVVNKIHIKGFSRDKLILNNNHSLPVSRTGFKELSI
jgi:two-component system LytT family response regulator